MKTPATPYCEHCGALIEVDSKFCAQCGNKLHKTAANQNQIQSEWPREAGEDPTGKPLTVVGICILAVVVGTVLFFGIYGSGAGRGIAVPSDVRQLIFDRSQFGGAISLSLPTEDSRKQFEEVRHTLYGMPPLIFTNAMNFDRQLLAYIIDRGFGRIESATLRSRYGNLGPKFFFFYEKAFRDLPGVRITSKGVTWVLGKRVLKAITYMNQYQASLMGVPITYCAVAFTYTVEGEIPGLGRVTKLFEGKAKAYVDPDDGKWKLENLVLADQGQDEFLELVRGKYSLEKASNLMQTGQRK